MFSRWIKKPTSFLLRVIILVGLFAVPSINSSPASANSSLDWTKQSATWTTPGPNLLTPLAASCPTAKFCVMSSNLAPTWWGEQAPSTSLINTSDGSNKWDYTLLNNPKPKLYTVLTVTGMSCFSATACFGVGNATPKNQDEPKVPFIVTLVPGKGWQPTFITSKIAGEKPDHSPILTSLSCATATNCVAVGQDGYAAIILQLTFSKTGDVLKKTDPTVVPRKASGTPDSLNSVSCTSLKDCVAVGATTTEQGISSPIVVSLVGTTWTRKALTLKSSDPSESFNLNSVSCVSSADGPNCVAVGTDLNQNSSAGLIEVLQNGKWSLGASGAKLKGIQLAGVSCPSKANCVAVGSYFSEGTWNHQVPYRATWNGTALKASTAKFPDYATGSLTGLACSSTSKCLTIGWTRNFDCGSIGCGGGLPQNSYAELFSVGKWATTYPDAPTQVAQINWQSTSCVVSGSCHTLGVYTDATNANRVVMSSLVKGKWKILPVALPVEIEPSTISGLQCTSETSCIAIGTEDIAPGVQQELILSIKVGTTISATAQTNNPYPKGAPNYFSPSLSCSDATHCVALFSYYGKGGLYFSTAKLSGTAWTFKNNMKADEGLGEIKDLSCPTSNYCVALVRFGSMVMNGSTWTIDAKLFPSGYDMNAIECFSLGSCIAIGVNYSNWPLEPSMAQGVMKDGVWEFSVMPNSNKAGTSLTSLTCSSLTSCVAAGYGQSRAVLDGKSWSVTPQVTDASIDLWRTASTIACSTARSCVFTASSDLNTTTLVVNWWTSSPAANAAPKFTNPATGTIAGTGSIDIQTSGWPNPIITEIGDLPEGINFVDNEDGSANLTGTSDTSGIWPIALNATNGIGTSATQEFLLVVTKSNSWVSADTTTNGPGPANSGRINSAACVKSGNTCLSVGTFQSQAGGVVSPGIIDTLSPSPEIVAVPIPSWAWDVVPQVITCLSATSCVVSGRVAGDSTTPFIATFNPQVSITDWKFKAASTDPSLISSPEVTAISCSDQDNCSIVGVGYDQDSAEQFLTATMVDGVVGSSKLIAGPTDAKGSPLTNVQPSGLQCSSATDCVATGNASFNTDYWDWAAFTAVESGGEWTTSRVILDDTQKNPRLNAMSCDTAISCTSVGSVQSMDGNTEPFYVFWDGESWTTSVFETVDGSFGGELRSISCYAENTCVAVGNAQDADNNQVPFISTHTADASSITSDWTGYGIPIEDIPSQTLVNVACSSLTECVALGSFGDVEAPTPNILEINDGQPVSNTVLNFPNFPKQSLSGVSCFETNCLAVGSKFYPDGSTGAIYASVEDDFSTVYDIETPEELANSALYGVSCTALNLCTAAGSSQDGNGNQAMIATNIDGVWTQQTIIPEFTVSNSKLQAISCSSDTFCMAVGTEAGPEDSVDKLMAVEWNGSSGTETVLPVPEGYSQVQFNSISCPTDTFCVAVGNTTDANGNQGPLVEKYSGGTWKLVNLTLPAQDVGSLWLPLTGVSCWDANQCIASGTGASGKLQATLAGNKWSVVDIAGDQGGYIQCLSATNCIQTTPQIGVQRWDGKTWTSDLFAAPNVLATMPISCGTVSCVVVGTQTAIEAIKPMVYVNQTNLITAPMVVGWSTCKIVKSKGGTCSFYALGNPTPKMAVDGSLPTGITFTIKDNLVTFKVTDKAAIGSSTFKINATNLAGQASLDITIQVN